MTQDELERTLRRLRLSQPSPELRRRILDACAASPALRLPWWPAWRPELALAAFVVLLLAAVLTAATPPNPPRTPSVPMSKTASRPPLLGPGDDETRTLLAAGLTVVPWSALPDWPPEIPRIEKRLTQELETPGGPSPRISSGEPPC